MEKKGFVQDRFELVCDKELTVKDLCSGKYHPCDGSLIMDKSSIYYGKCTPVYQENVNIIKNFEKIIKWYFKYIFLKKIMFWKKRTINDFIFNIIIERDLRPIQWFVVIK